MTKLKEIIIDQVAKTLLKFNKKITEFDVKFTKHTVTVYSSNKNVLIKLGKFTEDEIVVHYYKWINYLNKKIKELLQPVKLVKSVESVELVEPVESVELAVEPVKVVNENNVQTPKEELLNNMGTTALNLFRLFFRK